jgi:hypothetical protein
LKGHCGGIRPRLHTGADLPQVQSQSHIVTDSQSVCQSWCRAPCRVCVGRPDERTGLSFVYAAGPRQRSPLGLVTIFHCLRCETFLLVASYDSQGYGGGIRPHPPGTKVKVTLLLTVSRSVSLGVEPHLGLMAGYLLLFDS